MRFAKLVAMLVALVVTFWGCRTSAPPSPDETSQGETAMTPAEPTPPVAAVRPKQLQIHGHVRVDDYYWLKERENPEVVAYLEAENAYLGAVMSHTEGLQKALFDEIVARIPQEDESVPYLLDGYYYYSRYEQGKEYPIYCRRKGSVESPEEIMLDVNQLAAGHDYFAAVGISVSYKSDILAFSTDSVGRRIYTLRFRNLATGAYLPDEIPGVTGNVAWANDNRTIFYSKQNPDTLRWYQIWRHELGTDAATDKLVFQEDDETFTCYVLKFKSKEFLAIGSSQTLTDEYRILRADDPQGEFRVFQERVRGLEYSVDHYGDTFYVRTNFKAKNFRLMATPEDATAKVHWYEVIQHRDEVLLGGFEIFRDYLVIEEREDGLVRLRVRPWSGEGEHYVDFGEPAYRVSLGDNFEFDTGVLRFDYESLTTPDSVYDYDMATREKTLLKRDKVGGGFDSANYEVERINVKARDGALVPVSIVYRKGFNKDGSQPFLLYGYGSYGSTIDPSFNSSVLSLLDRGFGYAIAHVRGSQTRGRDWYENGKLLNKKNTFTDFIDVGDYLVEARYADRENLFAMGGSAGGLLMGAIVNLSPEMWKGIVARVPFVDVITTMLDPDIPLTTAEYDEWGDPNQKEYYDYILSYSPYDNVEAKDYPAMLVTAGLHDSQVQYWEPAKWVAKLRAMKTDHNSLLLSTNMEAGHGGASGRFKRHQETALIYAFMLDLVGVRD